MEITFNIDNLYLLYFPSGPGTQEMGGQGGKLRTQILTDQLTLCQSAVLDYLCPTLRNFRPSYGPAIQPNATACFSFTRRTPPIFMYTTRPQQL